MMSDWPEYQLKDLISIKHGFAYKGEFFSSEPTSEILVTPGNFAIGGGFKEDKFKYYNGPIQESYILKPGDLIVTMTDLSKESDTLGFSALVPDTKGVRYHHNQRIGLIDIKNKDLITKDYLYFLLRTNEYRHEVMASSTGTSVKHTSPTKILNFSFKLPPIEYQNDVAKRLLSFESKISNNTTMNSTLEKIAQRIFKSWFIDFDPVKANAESVQFDGLSPEIQALFPNEFEESELGMIPKGWEVKSLDEIAHFLNGLACQKHRPKDGETPLPVIKIAEMRAGYQEKTNEASPNVDPKYIIQDGDFLFSWSGSLTTCFWSHGPGVLNQHLFKVTSEDYPKWFFSMWVNIHLAEFIRIAADKATTMGHIKREHLSQAKVVVPNLKDLMSKGNDIFGPLIERSNLCLTQAKTLMKVRDKLLPRLISGKITIQKAEELLEEAS